MLRGLGFYTTVKTFVRTWSLLLWLCGRGGVVLPGSAALFTGSPMTRGALGLGYVDLPQCPAVLGWFLGRTLGPRCPPSLQRECHRQAN